MNETNAPLPLPSGVTCPNCGTVQSTSVAYCANCGAALPPAKRSNSTAVALKVIVAVLLFLGALGVGALGACVMFVGAIEGGKSANAATSGATAMFGFAVLLAVMGVAWIVFWVTRKS